MTNGITREQRHTRNHRCPICEGADEDPRGKAKRCMGFTTVCGKWCHCSREELSGAIPRNGAGLYAHALTGRCRCGETHGAGVESGIEAGIEATYDYFDGPTLLYQVVRKTGKRFLIRRPALRNGWVWSLNGTQRVLYKLNRLREPDSRVLYIVEGEKDVDTLDVAGHLATCNPGGAGKWSYVAALAREVLAGHDIVVVADADGPGRSHARDVAKSLEGVAKSLRVVECPKPHKDVSELLGAGLGLDALVAPGLQVVDETWTPTEEWREHLILGTRKRGDEIETVVANVAPNVAVFLRYHPDWAGVIAWDEFAERVVTTKPPPWVVHTGPSTSKPGPWKDEHTLRVIDWAARREKYNIKTAHVEQAVPVVAHTNVIHPVRAYLSGLRWDKVPRLHQWLSLYCGAISTDYTREMGKRWMISAVARVMKPGCQADLTLILEGPQGIGKSAIIRALVPNPEWFSETGIDIGEKDSYQALHGVWIYLLDELESMRRSDVARLKSFLTATKDHYRPPYARAARDFYRQNVFCGTTNEQTYFSDSTGNRRFLPVKVTVEPDVQAIESIRDQLWAEAYFLYCEHHEWWAKAAELRGICSEEQEARVQHDAWLGKVQEWLDGTARESISVGEVLSECFDLDASDWGQIEQTRVARCLQKLGYSRKRFRLGALLQWRYVQPRSPAV